MEHFQLRGKDIYIVHSHNQVLEAWEKQPGCNVFSLDFHTDTKQAFQNYSYWRADSEIKSGKCRNHDQRQKELMDEKIRQYRDRTLSIAQINDNLRHDEHIDFAVQSDIIDTAYICALNRNDSSSNPNVYIVDEESPYGNQRIIESSTSSMDHILEDSQIKTQQDWIAEFKSDFFNRFILDIDCDAFTSERSLQPDNSEQFMQIVRESVMITIALEPECVKICRQKGCFLESRDIVERLLTLIDLAMNEMFLQDL